MYDPLYWEECTREDVEASEADNWQAMVVGAVLVVVLALEVVVVVVEVIGDGVVAMDVELYVIWMHKTCLFYIVREIENYSSLILW